MSNADLPRFAPVTDRTLPQNLQSYVAPEIFFAFEKEARKRNLARSALLRLVLAKLTDKPKLFETLLGKAK